MGAPRGMHLRGASPGGALFHPVRHARFRWEGLGADFRCAKAPIAIKSIDFNNIKKEAVIDFRVPFAILDAA